MQKKKEEEDPKVEGLVCHMSIHNKRWGGGEKRARVHGPAAMLFFLFNLSPPSFQSVICEASL